MSEGFLNKVTLQPFHFISCNYFFKSLSWLGNILVGLLIWSAPAVVGRSISICSIKIPSYNALIQNTLFKKGIMNKSILSSVIGGHFERAKVKCPFLFQKCPSIFLDKVLLFQIPFFLKGHFDQGNFVKGYRRAFLERVKGKNGISTK